MLQQFLRKVLFQRNRAAPIEVSMITFAGNHILQIFPRQLWLLGESVDPCQRMKIEITSAAAICGRVSDHADWTAFLSFNISDIERVSDVSFPVKQAAVSYLQLCAVLEAVRHLRCQFQKRFERFLIIGADLMIPVYTPGNHADICKLQKIPVGLRPGVLLRRRLQDFRIILKTPARLLPKNSRQSIAGHHAESGRKCIQAVFRQNIHRVKIIRGEISFQILGQFKQKTLAGIDLKHRESLQIDQIGPGTGRQFHVQPPECLLRCGTLRIILYRDVDSLCILLIEFQYVLFVVRQSAGRKNKVPVITVLRRGTDCGFICGSIPSAAA